MAVLIALLGILAIALGVLFQDRLRGDDSPTNLAQRYLGAVVSGDRFTLLMLTHSGRDLTATVAERIERYRQVSPDELTVDYEAHSVAAYLLNVRIERDGRPFDEVGLQYIGQRWYIVGFSD